MNALESLPTPRPLTEKECLAQEAMKMTLDEVRRDLCFYDFDPEEARAMGEEAREVLVSLLLGSDERCDEPDEDPGPGGVFAVPAIMVPRPLAFPRAPFDAALRVHAEIVGQCERDLVAQARDFSGIDEPLEGIDDLAALIVEGPGGYDISMQVRYRIAGMLRRYRGIYRDLVLRAGRDRLYVVVKAEGTVSLRTLHLERPRTKGDAYRLRWDPGSEIVVEPARQHHTRCGKTLSTEYLMPGHRWYQAATVRIPREPASRAQAFDRMLALYEPEVRRKLAAHGTRSAAAGAQIATTPMHGEWVGVFENARRLPLMWRFPRMLEALEKPAPPGWVPVYLHSFEHAAVRWLPLQPTDASRCAPPPPVDEDAQPVHPKGADEPHDPTGDAAPVPPKALTSGGTRHWLKRAVMPGGIFAAMVLFWMCNPEGVRVRGNPAAPAKPRLEQAVPAPDPTRARTRGGAEPEMICDRGGPRDALGS